MIPRDRLSVLVRLQEALVAEIGRQDFWDDDRAWVEAVTKAHALTHHRRLQLQKRLGLSA